jgi:hypothetical protein
MGKRVKKILSLWSKVKGGSQERVVGDNPKGQRSEVGRRQPCRGDDLWWWWRQPCWGQRPEEVGRRTGRATTRGVRQPIGFSESEKRLGSDYHV